MTYKNPPRHFPSGSDDVFSANNSPSSPLAKIAPLIRDAISSGYYPGAVILAAQHNKTIYRGVFGSRTIIPAHTHLEFDSIFDTASLTKVVVTATAAMQLTETGSLKLDEPAASYWPDFAANGKSAITIRDLLTHTSGLQANIPSHQLNELLAEELRVPDLFEWKGKEEALQKIVAMQPQVVHGTGFCYSDVNFITLGHIIESIAGMDLQQYAKIYIFDKLNMQHSMFTPPRKYLDAIVPTQILSGELRWGEAHDPTIHLLGGIGGSAGLFSTAHDLGLFAQAILNQGAATEKNGQRILEAGSVAAMTSSHTSRLIAEKRGLGWDIDSAHSCRGSFSAKSFGHTGWTGTSMWIDPELDTWLVILTSRTHPTPHPTNKLMNDRNIISSAIADYARGKITPDAAKKSSSEVALSSRSVD